MQHEACGKCSALAVNLLGLFFLKQGKRFTISLIKKEVIDKSRKAAKREKTVRGLLSRHDNTHVLRSGHRPKRHLRFDLTDKNHGRDGRASDDPGIMLRPYLP